MSGRVLLEVLQRLKQIAKRSQNTWPTCRHLNYGVPGQLPFNRDFDRTERIREFSVLRQEWTECFINLCHCGDYSKSKAREKALGAASSTYCSASWVAWRNTLHEMSLLVSLDWPKKFPSGLILSFCSFLLCFVPCAGTLAKVVFCRYNKHNCFSFWPSSFEPHNNISTILAHWNLSTGRIVSLRSPTTSHSRLCGRHFGLTFQR
jgi:hypothetical protein